MSADCSSYLHQGRIVSHAVQPDHRGLQLKWSPPNISEAISRREPDSGFNSQTSIQPKDE
jgi:hypothetical protein